MLHSLPHNKKTSPPMGRVAGCNHARKKSSTRRYSVAPHSGFAPNRFQTVVCQDAASGSREEGARTRECPCAKKNWNLRNDQSVNQVFAKESLNGLAPVNIEMPPSTSGQTLHHLMRWCIHGLDCSCDVLANRHRTTAENHHGLFPIRPCTEG